MSAEHKELRVGATESSKRIMYLAKEFLLNNETVDIVAGTSGTLTAARVCETLVRLGYVTYNDIRTETNVINERRRSRVVISVKKTDNFKKLYDENEENRKKLQEANEAK